MSDQSRTYQYEKFIDVKKKKDKYFILIKWKGYDSKDNTWEPLDHLTL